MTTSGSCTIRGGKTRSKWSKVSPLNLTKILRLSQDHFLETSFRLICVFPPWFYARLFMEAFHFSYLELTFRVILLKFYLF